MEGQHFISLFYLGRRAANCRNENCQNTTCFLNPVPKMYLQKEVAAQIRPETLSRNSSPLKAILCSVLERGGQGLSGNRSGEAGCAVLTEAQGLSSSSLIAKLHQMTISLNINSRKTSWY